MQDFTTTFLEHYEKFNEFSAKWVGMRLQQKEVAHSPAPSNHCPSPTSTLQEDEKTNEEKKDDSPSECLSPPVLKRGFHELEDSNEKMEELTDEWITNMRTFMQELMLFFHYDEMMMHAQTYNPDVTVKDAYFKYERRPFTLYEAVSLHMAQKSAWEKFLTRLITLDGKKHELIVLPPIQQNMQHHESIVPETILVEADLYGGEHPIYYWWNTTPPNPKKFLESPGEDISQMLAMLAKQDAAYIQLPLENFITQLRLFLFDALEKDAQALPCYTFTGKRKEGQNVYAFYWTMEAVYCLELDLEHVTPSIPKLVRKSSFLPFNTVFCTPSSFRKFSLEVDGVYLTDIRAQLEKSRDEMVPTEFLPSQPENEIL